MEEQVGMELFVSCEQAIGYYRKILFKVYIGTPPFPFQSIGLLIYLQINK